MLQEAGHLHVVIGRKGWDEYLFYLDTVKHHPQVVDHVGDKIPLYL